MKVSISWLKELIGLKVPIEEVIRLLPLRTVGLKEVSTDFFELDMKGYNRADLLSMRGVAYEISAITDFEIAFQENSDYIWKNLNLPRVETEVEDSNLAPVYCLTRIEGLKAGQSSADRVKKLNGSGMRSVNNIADVTNLIMLEYGQPLHAFDAEKVRDETIIVRTAKKGEEIITLDNKKRKLETTDLLITDPEKALGIAGVMGGKNSEVSDSTTAILLEAAIFDPISIRKTATRLNLQSEASKRFQHGLTRKRLLQAFDAAIRMYETLGGKLTSITLTGDLADKTQTIKLTQEKVSSLIGIDIPPKEIESSLNKLGFKLASHFRSGNVNWDVTVPYWRLDIEIEEDLIEEVARMYGYEKIPATPLNSLTIAQNPVFGQIDSLKQVLINLGLTEVQTYSFYSTQVLNNLNLNKDELIKILNPMSAETEYLKDNLWPNLLEATAKNIRNGIKDVAIFEIGKVYWQEDNEPKEGYRLSIALSNGTDNPIQEFYQIYLEISKQLGDPGVQIQVHPWGVKDPVLDSGVANALQNDNFFHPARFTFLERDNKQIGFIAEVHPRIVNKFRIDQRVAVLEITVPL